MIKFYHLLTAIIFLVYLTPLLSQHYQSPEIDSSYQINVDEVNHSLSVKYCTTDHTRYFYSTSDKAEKTISSIKISSSTHSSQLRQRNGYIYVPRNLRNHQGLKVCLSYEVNPHIKSAASSRLRMEHPNDMIFEIDNLIWLPNNYDEESNILVSFKHNLAINVSAPWQLIHKDNHKTQYMMPYTPSSWMGHIAIGKFDIQQVKIGESTLHVALIKGENTINKNLTLNWIKSMAQAIASITGFFPIKELQVMIIFNSKSRGPVPWGQVNRFGGSGVIFVVNPNSKRKALYDDWTAAHEFSHLLVPYTPDDRWFSEGFASYYQNITRAKVGLLDESQAWGKLLAGLNRGKTSANKFSSPLVKNANSSHMMQMYWAGAALALNLEVAIYLQTDGKLTLADGLNSLRHCCLNSSKQWKATDVFKKIDEALGTSIVFGVYQKQASAKKFPDFKVLIEKLGIIIQRNGSIRLNDEAPYAHIRKNIIQAQSTSHLQ